MLEKKCKQTNDNFGGILYAVETNIIIDVISK